jgi:hypothetical protein
MTKGAGYRTMRDLIEALGQAERRLDQGDLDLQGLEQACEDVRQLYERLVVLRHRSRERMAQGKDQPPANTRRKEQDQQPIRLDTKPAEPPVRQTSLIEAIEETAQEAPAEKQQPVAPPPPPEPAGEAPDKKEAPAGKEPRPAEPKKPATVAEKLEKASISSLARSITLSHKFWFVSELYNGDRIFYEKSITQLDTMTDLEAARTFVRTEVIANLKKPADPDALNTFMDLIERRFQ